MDLRFLDALPSSEEQAAVDAVLGPPDSAWVGGARTEDDLRRAHGGHAARGQRHLLLPVLHAVNDRVGYLSQAALDYVCRRLTVPPAEAYGVATFYAMFAVRERPKKVMHVCTDIACKALGSDALVAELEERVGHHGPRGADAEVEWHHSPCLGMCERGPAALTLEAGEPPTYAVSAPATCEVLARLGGRAAPAAAPGDASANGHREGAEVGLAPVDGAAFTGAAEPAGAAAPPAGAPADASAEPPARTADPSVEPAAASPLTFGTALIPGGEPEPPAEAAVPQAGDPELVLLRRIGTVDPESLDDYRAAGGYNALRQAFKIGPARVIQEVLDSGLVGRGGAAFPTGRKWDATARQPDRPKYLICNADESEPGTFKDRVVIEGDPFSLVESMTIAGYAIGATHGYVYLRGEYPRALQRLENALAAARERNLLGTDILGTGFDFDIEVRRGAGAYICGEETAIFNSIEGERGEPRSKPPFPVEKGLFGKPTVINNVETLINVLPILEMGGPGYAAIGTGRSTGPKLFCVSGTVRRPGIYELPFGATLRELLELAGGAPEGREIRAVLLGGAAGGFVRGDELDIPLTFEGTREAGTTLGSGVILVLDDTVDLGGVLLRIAQFFRDESCGQCVPCRVGTVRQEEALHRMVNAPAGRRTDLTLLREVGGAMRDASICGLGQTAWNAVESAIDRLGVFPLEPAGGSGGTSAGTEQP
ncbi:NAD(P)H-dependent oxidoreductase subunit E [Allonocardiopsis opalescens]|uniref:NADH-quinone oxidoreductase subunit F n=1 Tax=Allonocardiopsis opalescens TaxID=1144618 RepID=A0A2T0PYJ9_9ACTN|nr:NAD(P)H-dependent oxidoreductase subunit E [Allonocardiopsis opalescens]PRX96497.1 NADH-quinone oxidoreductase subunit F [Allonocardiopsis opalescens]